MTYIPRKPRRGDAPQRWRDYANAIGVPIGQWAKQDIIEAVEAHEAAQAAKETETR